MKYMSPIAVSVLCSVAALVAVTACSSHKAPANVKPAAQSSANAQSAVAGQAWEAPASIKGKTFSFAAPFTLGYRADGGTFRSDSYAADTIAWKWGNKKELVTHENGWETTANYEYKKTGKKTALLGSGLVQYVGPGRPESMYKEYVMTFETPTSGTCTLEVTGPGHSIGAEKYTATGRFTLK